MAKKPEARIIPKATEQVLEEILIHLLDEIADNPDFLTDDSRYEAFSPLWDARVSNLKAFLCKEHGVHLRLADHSEWTLTIQCYRRPRDDD